ncbi:penicillopepsin [Pochonia chlamydosporia 170]|uniref:Penicillopepsin n=1 Tax=Pochonia chlamydosporia 170 TaxID=1380566 RepID=A0A179G0A7_METCM|nr:penicillopepsin [Pochonia chlamydosporia 170]OAQ70781.1 penicillopepsin [Pochonia chlamydosporia 170]
MHTLSFFVYLCAVFACATLTVADIQKRSFLVERVPNPKFTGRNGPRAMVKAHRKFLMPLPEGLVAAMEAQDKKLAAAQAKRGSNSFQYFDRSEADRRGLIGELLGDLGLGGGKQNGKQDGNQNGNNANQNSNNGNQNANGNGNGNGNKGNKNGNGSTPPPVKANNTAPAPGTGARNQTGTVAAKPEKNDAEYISPVKIGGQTVNLDFDTGSSDLWVFNTQLAASVTNGHRVYDPAKSKTFKMMAGSQFTISYGDGSGAKGNVGTDVVDVGGAAFPAQPVELATAVSQEFIKDQNNDGLMGLAFSKINTVKPQKQQTFFDNIKPSLAQPVFTADLRKGAAGAYTFGTIDQSKFQGALAWVPVNNTNGFWQFSSEKFAVNGGKPQAGTSGGQAIADTGTSLMLADAKIVTAYYAQVQGAKNDQQVGGFTFPCNTKLPDLAVDVGGVYMAKVTGDNINFAQVGNGMCFGGVQATPQGQLGIYGDIFFKSQFVAFNGGNNSLGMAPHK